MSFIIERMCMELYRKPVSSSCSEFWIIIKLIRQIEDHLDVHCPFGSDLHSLKFLGKRHRRLNFDPLAVVSSNVFKLTVPAIEVINNYFGRKNLPTGAFQEEYAPRMNAPHRNGMNYSCRNTRIRSTLRQMHRMQ